MGVWKIDIQTFPSPIGESYFSIVYFRHNRDWQYNNFRPLSGNLIFQFSRETYKGEKFPSPIGESYFSINIVNEYNCSQCQFPSPIGESYFSMKLYYLQITMHCVFPSPIGESYFSIWQRKSYRTTENLISVPYRGILFFNTLSHTCLFLRAARALCVGKRFFMEFLVFIRVQYPRKPWFMGCGAKLAFFLYFAGT